MMTEDNETAISGYGKYDVGTEWYGDVYWEGYAKQWLQDWLKKPGAMSQGATPPV